MRFGRIIALAAGAALLMLVAGCDEKPKSILGASPEALIANCRRGFIPRCCQTSRHKPAPTSNHAEVSLGYQTHRG